MVTGRFGHPVSNNAMASIRIMAGADLAVVRTVSPPSQRVRARSAGIPGRLRHLKGTGRTSCYFAKPSRRLASLPGRKRRAGVTCGHPGGRPPSRGREEQEMSYDLVIKNGWVVDGFGQPRYR